MSTKRQTVIEGRVLELMEKTQGELQALFAETVGEPTRCPNRVFLARRIAQAEEQAATAAPAPAIPELSIGDTVQVGEGWDGAGARGTVKEVIPMREGGPTLLVEWPDGSWTHTRAVRVRRVNAGAAPSPAERSATASTDAPRDEDLAATETAADAGDAADAPSGAGAGAVDAATDPAGDAAPESAPAAPQGAPDTAPAPVDDPAAGAATAAPAGPTRDPRLPPAGAVIERTYKGETYRVTFLEDGVECAGQRYRSLSGLARHITGQIQNGFRFFNLGEKDTETARARRATLAASARDDSGARLLARLERFLAEGEAPAAFVARLGELAAAAAGRRAA